MIGYESGLLFLGEGACDAGGYAPDGQEGAQQPEGGGEVEEFDRVHRERLGFGCEEGVGVPHVEHCFPEGEGADHDGQECALQFEAS